MIRDQTDPNVIQCIPLIGLAAKRTDLIPDCLHRVNIKHGIHVLHDNGETLQAHTRIDILLLKLLIAALAVSVELSKYVVQTSIKRSHSHPTLQSGLPQPYFSPRS